MRTEQEVLTQFDKWARGNDQVRAAVLTSSRANPERETDFLSDYDIELYVADLESFRRDDEWLSAFGPIMVRWSEDRARVETRAGTVYLPPLRRLVAPSRGFPMPPPDRA